MTTADADVQAYAALGGLAFRATPIRKGFNVLVSAKDYGRDHRE